MEQIIYTYLKPVSYNQIIPNAKAVFSFIILPVDILYFTQFHCEVKE